MLGSIIFSSIVLADQVSETKQAISDHMKEEPVVGLSCTIMQKGKVVFSEGFGWQDRENEVKATENTIYRLASISKTITAVTTMKLLEQGKIQLDTPLTEYKKNWPTVYNQITPRHIMTHSSGIRHYATGKSDNGTTHYKSADEASKLFINDDLLFKPGSKYSYSTHAYTALAAVIERITGENFGEYVYDNVSKPAGATTLAVEDLTKPIPKNRSQLYGKVASLAGKLQPPQDNSWKYAGGGFESSSLDLAKYGNAVMNGKIIKPETVKQMWTKQVLGDGTSSTGLGWVMSEPTVARHAGAQQGSATYILVDFENQIVITLLSNTSGISTGTLMNKIYSYWKPQELR